MAPDDSPPPLPGAEPAPQKPTPGPTKPRSEAPPVHEAELAIKSSKKQTPARARASATPRQSLPTNLRGDHKRTPVYKKWYFWVAVGGAVVITGFIIGMAASSNDRTTTGSSSHDLSQPGGGATLLRF